MGKRSPPYMVEGGGEGGVRKANGHLHRHQIASIGQPEVGLSDIHTLPVAAATGSVCQTLRSSQERINRPACLSDCGAETHANSVQLVF